MDATTVGVDLAKTVFALALANAQWRVVGRQQLNRAGFARFLAETAPTHVVMEACGTAHYWGRLAQQHGHRVTLVPPGYVRPYVRRNKTDRADAEAILEAVRSGQMPTVAVKRVEQQALVALHRTRASARRSASTRTLSMRRTGQRSTRWKSGCSPNRTQTDASWPKGWKVHSRKCQC